jgi:hypothetical protein
MVNVYTFIIGLFISIISYFYYTTYIQQGLLTRWNCVDYQNLAEAEYCVAVFMYMRLIGYPADKISILTTYNGQKHLIRDVINIRCATNPLIGRPHKVQSVVCKN